MQNTSTLAVDSGIYKDIQCFDLLFVCDCINPHTELPGCFIGTVHDMNTSDNRGREHLKDLWMPCKNCLGIHRNPDNTCIIPRRVILQVLSGFLCDPGFSLRVVAVFYRNWLVFQWILAQLTTGGGST